MIKCATCGASFEDKPLYRSTPKGQDPVWKCEDCISFENKPSKDLKNIMDTFYDKK